MSFSDHFEQAFCINLDKRKDKWRQSKKEFNKVGIKVERVSAIDGFLEEETSIRPGELGCLKSHLKVFEIAKERNLDSFLMLEDDVEFIENFNERFEIIEPQIPNYTMLYLGLNPHTGSRHEVTPNVYRIMGACPAHCIVFKKDCFDDIIEDLKNPVLYPVDVVYGQRQIKHLSYAIRPSLTWQRKSFSDINQESVDYEFLR